MGVQAMADDAAAAIAAAEALFAGLGDEVEEEEEEPQQKKRRTEEDEEEVAQPRGPSALLERKKQKESRFQDEDEDQEWEVDNEWSAPASSSMAAEDTAFEPISEEDLPYAHIASVIRSVNENFPDTDGYVLLSTIAGKLSLTNQQVLQRAWKREDLFSVKFDSVDFKQKVALTGKGKSFGENIDDMLDDTIASAAAKAKKDAPDDDGLPFATAKAKAKWGNTKLAEVAAFIYWNRDPENDQIDTQTIQALMSISNEKLLKMFADNPDIFEVLNEGQRWVGRLIYGDRMRLRLTKLGEECASAGPRPKKTRGMSKSTALELIANQQRNEAIGWKTRRGGVKKKKCATSVVS